MHVHVPVWLLCSVAFLAAEEPQIHRFDAGGRYQPVGWPDKEVPGLLVLAEKPLRLHYKGVVANGPLTVHLHRVTAGRKIPLEAPAVEVSTAGWGWTWTPPATRGPARYEVRFDADPERIVHIESRDPSWLKATLDMLRKADWNADGLTREELAALADHGVRPQSPSAGGKDATASLQMIPQPGDASRRRVVWDKENPSLVVWRSGPVTGDVEVRAPRWWISPAALATDHGLIRFLDLYSEPPLQP